MTHPQVPSRFQDQPQRSKSGQWPNFWKSASWLPKQLEYSSHSLAYEITHSYKSWRGLSRWLSGKESVCNAGNPGLILGQEDPLEEEMATHFSILAWKIPWTEEPGGLHSKGWQRVRYDWANTKHPHAYNMNLQVENFQRGERVFKYPILYAHSCLGHTVMCFHLLQVAVALCTLLCPPA